MTNPSLERENINLQVGVKVFLQRKDGRYLILKRSPSTYPELKNSWDLPGGRIIAGDTLLNNLKREVKEETNLSLTPPITLLAAQDIIFNSKHVVRLTYSCRVFGTPSINKGEHEEYLWVTKEELERMQDLDQYTKLVIRLI